MTEHDYKLGGSPALPQGSAGVSMESEDMSKWEMETEPLLDKIYHRLLGHVENEEGEWIPNKGSKPLINELGASKFTQELRMRFNPNMQFSELDDSMIRHLSSEVGRNFASDLEDNFREWETGHSEAKLKSLCDELVHAVYIFLRIAKDGGMKVHREKRGIKSYFNPSSGVGVY